MPDNVVVHGLPELERATVELVDRIADKAPESFERVADDVAQNVRSQVPRRTGMLASAVDVGRAGDTVTVSHGAVYAGWVEYGGTRNRPYIRTGRWLYPTAAKAAAEFQRAGEDTARDEIRGMRWPQAR